MDPSTEDQNLTKVRSRDLKSQRFRNSLLGSSDPKTRLYSSKRGSLHYGSTNALLSEVERKPLNAEIKLIAVNICTDKLMCRICLETKRTDMRKLNGQDVG